MLAVENTLIYFKVWLKSLSIDVDEEHLICLQEIIVKLCFLNQVKSLLWFCIVCNWSQNIEYILQPSLFWKDLEQIEVWVCILIPIFFFMCIQPLLSLLLSTRMENHNDLHQVYTDHQLSRCNHWMILSVQYHFDILKPSMIFLQLNLELLLHEVF